MEMQEPPKMVEYNIRDENRKTATNKLKKRFNNLTALGNKNTIKLINSFTKDDIIEAFKRFDIEDEFIDNFIDEWNFIFRPSSIAMCFDFSSDKTFKSAKVMIATWVHCSKGAIELLNTQLSTMLQSFKKSEKACTPGTAFFWDKRVQKQL